MATKLEFVGLWRNQLYEAKDIEAYEASKSIKKFIARKAAINEKTAESYGATMLSFAAFVRQELKKAVDELIEKMKEGKPDPYEILSDYATFLKNSRKGKTNMVANTIRQYVIVTKKFLRVSGVKIDSEDFRELVDLPRKERSHKMPIERKDVIEILNACEDLELKTAILLFATTGGRAAELTSLRIKDLNLDGKAPSVTFRKEFTKMREDRRTLLTREAVNQIRIWLKTKYAPHRTTITKEGKESQERVIPESSPDDTLFGLWHRDGTRPKPNHIAQKIRTKLGKLLTVIKKDEIDEGGRRRAITLHSFRRFVKTTISNQGYGDFSEWHIGHASSGIRQTYFNQSEKDSLEIFSRIEPALTFLDATQLESYHADITNQLDQVKAQNRIAMQELSKREGIEDKYHALVKILIGNGSLTGEQAESLIRN